MELLPREVIILLDVGDVLVEEGLGFVDVKKFVPNRRHFAKISDEV